VLDLSRTLAAVFPQVLLWESGPGEFLVLASMQTEPLCNAPLLARFNTPQAQRLFGRIAWDCSQPLSLMTIDGSELLAGTPESGRIATAANPHFDFGLPLEVARWDDKTGALVQRLSGCARAALDRIPAVDARSDMEQRVADVAEQRQLITQFPDHFWAYRKSLRERLQQRPRSVIQQMKHELHPEDARRQDYLESLGEAATVSAPSPDQLHAVAEFAEPFDPLVSPFLHRELAQLWARASTSSPAAELHHWLHAAYFSPGYDRSVRDATAALTLLIEHPESMPDAARRWDHINALLETLKHRWTLRSQNQSRSRFDASDISATMLVAQRGLNELRSNADAAGIDPQWASTRAQVLERTFIRALRSHHAELTRQEQSLRRQQTALEASRAVSQ
jgi:hypothetical protein